MSRSIDITGECFGRLTALKRDCQTESKMWKWHCVCECSNRRSIRIADLRNGHSQSCGYDRYDSKFKDWEPRDWFVYTAWQNMKARCNNTNLPCYPNYGGRGITYISTWDIYENFFRDMGYKPTANHSLDRRNNELGYTPDNCRWATPQEQSDNKRPYGTAKIYNAL